VVDVVGELPAGRLAEQDPREEGADPDDHEGRAELRRQEKRAGAGRGRGMRETDTLQPRHGGGTRLAVGSRDPRITPVLVAA
jgi:hypothetical protein